MKYYEFSDEQGHSSPFLSRKSKELRNLFTGNSWKFQKISFIPSSAAKLRTPITLPLIGDWIKMEGRSSGTGPTDKSNLRAESCPLEAETQLPIEDQWLSLINAPFTGVRVPARALKTREEQLLEKRKSGEEQGQEQEGESPTICLRTFGVKKIGWRRWIKGGEERPLTLPTASRACGVSSVLKSK